MPQLQNSDLRKLPSEKSKGLAGTIIIHLILLLVLVFVSFSVPPPPVYEEGIEVNFGTSETGFGDLEPAPVAEQIDAVPPPPANESVKTVEEPLLTQDDEEAPEVKKVDPEAEKKKKEQAELDRIKHEELEAEKKRKELEEAETKRIEAEKKREAEMRDKMKSAFDGKNAGSTSTSEGNTSGKDNQGDKDGGVTSNVRGPGGGTGNSGPSYNLEGRTSIYLPDPKLDYQKEGKVVVQIRVNRDGKVIYANPGEKGSDLLDTPFLDAAKKAAMEAKFKPDPNAKEIQVGTITYNFKLK